MNTIYGIYTSDGLTRLPTGHFGRKTARSGGEAKFFARAEINLQGVVSEAFGLREPRNSNGGGILVASPKRERTKGIWTTQQ